MKALAGRLALLVFGLVAGLSLVEVVLRLTPGHRHVADLRGLHEVRPDRPWLYGLRPRAEGRIDETGPIRYAINADGFRDRLYARPKPPGTFRIVVLGDSIAFGYGVAEQEAFPKVLEGRMASSAPRRRVEVVNLGVSGYSPFNEEALFADVGVTYEPDLVVVEFCTNDLGDPSAQFDVLTGVALGNIPDVAYPDPSHRRVPLVGASVALRLCRRLRTCSLLDDVLRAQGSTRITAADLASSYPSQRPPEQEIAWLRARYDGIKRAAGHAALAVVLFPERTEIRNRNDSYLHKRLLALGHEAGWLTIDLLPAFREATKPGQPQRLFLDLWHPSRDGHRLAGHTIFKELDCHLNLLGVIPHQPESCAAASR